MEPLIHLDAEHRVDDHFEGAEADGADGDAQRHLALHDAIESVNPAYMNVAIRLVYVHCRYLFHNF